MSLPAKTFGINYWEGVIGGAALGSPDADPNTTPPDPTRTPRVSWDAKSAIWPATLKVFAGDGTTITVQPWFFDDSCPASSSTRGRWIKLCPTITATPATPGTNTNTPNVGGAKIFMQITANTGVAALGWLFG